MDFAVVCRRNLPAKGILGVLEQFEDEVRTIIVALSQQHRADATNVFPVAKDILSTKLGIISRHKGLRVEA